MSDWTIQALASALAMTAIMALRYLSGKTQVEVANEIGISQAQVSRLEKGALSQFRTRD